LACPFFTYKKGSTSAIMQAASLQMSIHQIPLDVFVCVVLLGFVALCK
jgi:hypothetical protein